MMRFLRRGGDPQERRLIISRFLQRVGGECSYFVGILGFATYDMHASAALIATIMFALNAAQMVGSLIAGFFIDRLGPRRVLLASQVGLTACLVATQFVGRSTVAFIAVVTVMGILFAFFNTGFAAFAPYIASGTDDLKRVNSLTEVAAYGATIIGPLIGAAIVTHAPTVRVFLFGAVSTALSMIFMWRLTERYAPMKYEEEKHPIREVKEGFKLVFSKDALRFFLLANVLVYFSFGAYDSLESLYYKDVVGVGVEWMGYVNAVIGIGLLVGAFVLGRFKTKQINIKMLSFLILLEGAGSLLYVGTRSIWFVMAGALVLGFAFGAAEPLMRTLIQAVSPIRYVGRVMGAMQLCRVGGTLIPLVMAPWLSEQFGVQGVLVGASALTVLFAASFFVPARRLDAQTAGTIAIDHIDPFADGEDASVHDREVHFPDPGEGIAEIR